MGIDGCIDLEAILIEGFCVLFFDIAPDIFNEVRAFRSMASPS
jgi:hypothetical protein